MRFLSKLAVINSAVLALSGVAASASADPVFFVTEAPYLSENDSPFNGSGFSYFHLENFEDGALNTPGVSASGGHTIGWDPYVDSVENGSSGHSWYSGFTESSFTFTFDADELGGLPTHVGIVWTDIGFNSPTPYHGPVTFEAFGPTGTWLGGLGPYWLGDGMDTGQKAEDRFFGAIFAGGISSIRIGTNTRDWEVDHLQYGSTSPTAVPEPSTILLLGMSAASLLRKRMKEDRRKPIE
jgi:hypothetical protein